MAVCSARVSGVCLVVLITDKEAKDSRVPASVEFSKKIEVFPQKLLGVKVHSCIMYFSPKDKRSKVCSLTKNTPTAPEGLFIWRKTGELRIPLDSSELENLGFCKQGCYPAMGFHHTKNICPNQSTCKDLGPFTILSDPKSKEVIGFVFNTFGSKIQTGHWIEKYVEAGFRLTIPHAQQCVYDYANLYYINNVHFYLGQKPWKNIRC